MKGGFLWGLYRPAERGGLVVLLSIVLAISRLLFGLDGPKAYIPKGEGSRKASPIMPKRRGQVGPVEKSIRRKVRARYR